MEDVLRRGADLLRQPPSDLSARPLYRITGSVLVAAGEDERWLRAAASRARAAGIDCREARAGAVADRLLGLDPPPGDLAVLTATDGVADPAEVVEALRKACGRLGVVTYLSAEATLTDARPGRVRIRMPRMRLTADVAVVAAGPWSEELARQAGSVQVALRSMRRHLFHTGPLEPPPAPDAAWVWDLSRGLYLRPEGPGLLLSACDEEPRLPEHARPDDAAPALLAEAVARAAPSLLALPVARTWAGLRTFAADRRLVLGRDPQAPGLVWATGLGGHGLTSCLEVGLRVARAVEDETLPGDSDPFRPARCLAQERREPVGATRDTEGR